MTPARSFLSMLLIRFFLRNGLKILDFFFVGRDFMLLRRFVSSSEEDEEASYKTFFF
jgi:hypothetical protein